MKIPFFRQKSKTKSEIPTGKKYNVGKITTEIETMDGDKIKMVDWGYAAYDYKTRHVQVNKVNIKKVLEHRQISGFLLVGKNLAIPVSRIKTLTYKQEEHGALEINDEIQSSLKMLTNQLNKTNKDAMDKIKNTALK